MPAYKLAVVNHTSVPQADVDAFAVAAQRWVSQYLASAWPEVNGTSVRSVPPGGQPAGDEALIVLAPNTTLANSLGYHDWTQAGLPMGIVELDSCQKYNVPWTIPGTHEIGELLINPRVANYVAVGNLWYPKEICDPVTSDRFQIGAVSVANAVTPAWFDQQAPAGSRFDLMGTARAPIPAIPAGGWLEWWDGQSWQNAWGQQIAPEILGYMQERRGRRDMMHRGHASWTNSTL